MKKFLMFLILFIYSVFVVSTVASADKSDRKTNSAFTWSFYSNFIWQGLELNKFSLSNPKVPKQGVSFTPWGTVDSGFSSFGKEGGKPLGLLSYQDGFALTDEATLNWKLGWLTYDSDARENEKAFAGIGLNTFLSPQVNFWKGKESNQDSWTINFALSKKWNFNNDLYNENGWSFGLGSGVSYSSFDNVEYNDLRNANVWADLNIPFKDGASLTPSINYSFPMNDVKNDLSGEGNFRGFDSGFVFGGVDLKIPF